MANKYIIHGATYCGDGTASNEAASVGAAGAWNDINVLEGSAPAQGALAAGDTVTIRSKTSAGADITRTLAASIFIGSTAATAANWITWILDNGVVWPGIDGTLTYTNAPGYTAIYQQNNVFASKTHHNWMTKLTGTSPTGRVAVVQGYGEGLAFDFSAKTSTGSGAFIAIGNGGVLDHPSIKCGRIANGPSDYNGAIQFLDYDGGVITLINPEIELTSSVLAGTVFSGAYQGSGVCKVIGGRIFGVGAVSGQAVFGSYGTSSYAFVFDTAGLSIPRSMDIINTSTSRAFGFECRVSGADSLFGGHLECTWGFATSRTDNNPPYLAAELPDSAHTAWSWRIWPRSASAQLPMSVTNAKLYSGTAATKTITQEILVANTMAPTKKTLWMIVTYIDDATGLPKSISTRDYSAPALATSTANWSATTWGMVTLLKRKFEVTTPTTIRQNSPITVTLMSTLAASTVNDVYFADPDFGVN